jgi:uncharacterized phage protein (TIGR02218 family)
MRSIPAPLAAHLAQNVTTLAVCWRVTRKDNVLILGTEHDADITVSAAPYAGTYVAQAGITGSDVRSTSDMSVDNLEVTGAVNKGDLQLVDLSAADIEAGLFDDASVTLFMVNWQAPDDGQIVLRTGRIGEISRTEEGQYKAELRGLAQRLSQIPVRTYGASCDAELGDARCGYVFAPGDISTGVVTDVFAARRFEATFAESKPVNYYSGGLLIWDTGDNAGFSIEVKADALGSPPEVEIYLAMPYPIQIGDTFTVKPGCDKSPASCKMKFNNLVNFRGHGAWVPGAEEAINFGGQKRRKKKKNKNLFDAAARGFIG